MRRYEIVNQLIGEKASIGAEIGVYHGETSAYLLSHNPNLKLYSIDSWGRKENGESVACSNYDYGDEENNFRIAKLKLEAFGERSDIMRMVSSEAAVHFKTGSLDFVFIDADHSYTAVSEDIKRWYRTLKRGGLLIGHDYALSKTYKHILGVKRAVDEFASKRQLQLYQDAQLHEVYVWAIKKK